MFFHINMVSFTDEIDALATDFSVLCINIPVSKCSICYIICLHIRHIEQQNNLS